MRTVVLVMSLWMVGCGRVPCGDEPPRLVGPSPGNRIYCSIREAEKQKRGRQANDVDRCIQQGGDAVGCRTAVYGLR